MIITNQSGVTYDYTLPDQTTLSGQKDSNVVNTEVLTYAVSKVKSSDRTFMLEGQQSRQTSVITNNSSATLKSLFFSDVLSDGAAYVNGSVTVGGVPYPLYDPEAGFNLNDLLSGNSSTVQYLILSNNPRTVDNVTNTGVYNFSVDDPVRGPVNFSQNTNTVEMRMLSPRLSVVKSVDKTFAEAGENLHYTTVVTNTGNVKKTNLVFTDAIPAGTTYVNGSVKIDGVAYPSYNPEIGFSLPDLDAGQSSKVEFDVKVN